MPMKKILLAASVLSALILTGCKSETGRQNIQYIRPVEDTLAHDDVDYDKMEDNNPETDIEEWAEAPLIDVGEMPEQEDFSRMRDENADDELERMLMGK